MSKPLILDCRPSRCGWLLLGILGTAILSGHAAADTLTIKTNFYSVSGATLRELWSAQAQQRPWKSNAAFAARTQWKMTWKFSAAADGDRYRIREFALTTEVTMTLPRWRPPPDADTNVVTHWTRYYQALITHELGHVAIARQAATELRRQVDNLASAGSGAELRNRIQQTVNATQELYRRRERDYDIRTRHGATQGAVLPRGRWEVD